MKVPGGHAVKVPGGHAVKVPGGHAVRVSGVVAIASVALLLAGCTLSADDGEAAPTGAPPSSPGDSTPATTRSATPTRADGPTPEELSEQVLAAGEAQAARPALGSVTAVVNPPSGEVALDVVAIDAVDDGTLVALRLTAVGEPVSLTPTTFASQRYGTQNFVRDVYLEDVAGGVRYRPLQFEDYREACVCPYIPLEIGSEPQTVYALFPALPEGVATVDIRLAGSDLVVAGLPVGG